MEDGPSNSSFSHTEFHLHGFPGLSQSRHLLAMPILVMSILILAGNSTMAYIIWVEKTLHLPMYILISLTFMGNISCTLTFMPKLLVGLTLGLEQITLVGCLSQMFFIYASASFDSNVLLLMAVDRYVAISFPLRYHLIMTKQTLAGVVILSVVRSLLFISLTVGVTSTVRFCGSNIILNFVCENMSLLNLGCGDISRVQAVGLWVRVLLTAMDVTLVVVSYVRILLTVRKIAAGKAREKARNTCSTQLLVAMVTYSCGLSSSIVYRIGPVISSDLQNTMSFLNYVIPAAADPIIYGAKMTEIRNRLKKSFP